MHYKYFIRFKLKGQISPRVFFSQKKDRTLVIAVIDQFETKSLGSPPSASALTQD